jgi:hypothetical protein
MRLVDEFVQDARYAMRSMRRASGFTAVAALVLLADAGLLMENFRRVSNVDLGFRKTTVEFPKSPSACMLRSSNAQMGLGANTGWSERHCVFSP